MKNSSVIDFVQTNFESKEDFLLVCSKALISIPLDVFSNINYSLGHLLIARTKYLQDKDEHSLISLGILWDVSKLFSNFSSVQADQKSAFKDLTKIFNMQYPSQSELTQIFAFDLGFNEEYLKESASQLSLHYTNVSKLYGFIKANLK